MGATGTISVNIVSLVVYFLILSSILLYSTVVRYDRQWLTVNTRKREDFARGSAVCGCASARERNTKSKCAVYEPQVRATQPHKCCKLHAALCFRPSKCKNTRLRNRALHSQKQTLVCTKLCTNSHVPSAKWSGNDLIRACSELHGPVPMCPHSVDTPRGHLWQRKRSGQRRRRALRGPHS